MIGVEAIRWVVFFSFSLPSMLVIELALLSFYIFIYVNVLEECHCFDVPMEGRQQAKTPSTIASSFRIKHLLMPSLRSPHHFFPPTPGVSLAWTSKRAHLLIFVSGWIFRAQENAFGADVLGRSHHFSTGFYGVLRHVIGPIAGEVCLLVGDVAHDVSIFALGNQLPRAIAPNIRGQLRQPDPALPLMTFLSQ